MRDWQQSQWPHLSGSQQLDPRNIHVPRPWETPTPPTDSDLGIFVAAAKIGLVIGTLVTCYGWLQAHVWRYL